MNDSSEENGSARASTASTRSKSRSPRRYAQQLLYLTVTFCLRFLALPTKIRVKRDIAPTVRLDYDKAKIYLHADYANALTRSRACRKEPSTVDWLETQLRDGDVLYDIGANIGAYSLVAARQSGKKITVCAFEPSFSTYHQLCRNIILNNCQSSITAYMNPLAAQTGHAVFHYQSTDAGAALHSLGDSVTQTGDQFAPAYSQSVISFSLDELIERFSFPVPHLIKLDVDGIELDILHGAKNTLDKPLLRSLLVEIDNNAPEGLSAKIVSLLCEHGFELAIKASNGVAVQNYVFMRVPDQTPACEL